MQHLEGSGMPVLHIQNARFLKVKPLTAIISIKIVCINFLFKRFPVDKHASGCKVGL